MELVLLVTEERTKNTETRDSVMSIYNRISDSESDEYVGGIQRRVCEIADVVCTWMLSSVFM
jgi:hypothetical protein